MLCDEADQGVPVHQAIPMISNGSPVPCWAVSGQLSICFNVSNSSSDHFPYCGQASLGRISSEHRECVHGVFY